MDFRELGFDANLFRGDSSGSLYPLPEGSTTGSAIVSQGLTDPLNNPVLPSQLGSGEYNQILNVGREGAIMVGATGYLTGQGIWQGYRIAEKDYAISIGDPDGTYLSYNTTDNTLTINSGPTDLTSGSIAGMTISATALTATSGGNSTVISSGTTAFSAGPTGSPTVTISQAGVLTATGVVISGSISVSAGGTIGGFDVGSDYVRDVANSFGLASTVTGGDDVRFWAGNTFANRATAPLRFFESGAAVFTSITATGTINATGGFIGTSTALVFESTGINTGTTGHIRGGQTDYNTGTGFFLGYSGAAYKFSIGNTTTDYLTFDGTNLSVSGSLVAQTVFTAGENIAAGDVVAISSADNVKRTFPTGYGTADTRIIVTADATGTGYGGGFFLDVSSTLKAYINFNAYGSTNPLTVNRVIFIEATGIVSSVTANTFGGIVSPDYWDAEAIGSSKVMTVMSKDSNNLRATCLDLSSSISIGSEVTIDTTNTNHCSVGYISDSHVLFFKEDTSTGAIVFHKYTLSGTTLSSSSTGDVVTPTGTYTLSRVRRFGTTNYFLIVLDSSTDSTSKAYVALYDTGASTFSVGSVVNFPASERSSNAAHLESISDTEMMACLVHTDTIVKACFITRSGTVPTINTSITLTAPSAGNVTWNKWNANTVVYGSTNGTTANLQFVEIGALRTTVTSRLATTFTEFPPPTGGFDVRSGTQVAFKKLNVNRGVLAVVFGTGSPSQNFQAISLTTNYDNVVGVANASATSGNSVTIISNGLTTAKTGLTAATAYYYDIGGTMGTGTYGYTGKVGVAKDTNELIVAI